MQKEKMSVHRGLAEIKLLDSRIGRAITEGIYCTHNKRSNQKIQGMEIQDFKDKIIKSSFDKVEELIKRRQRIKSAIVKSNAMTDVEIAGNKMSVAEAIERKISIEHDREFLNKLKQQYSTALLNIERNNATLMQHMKVMILS